MDCHQQSTIFRQDRGLRPLNVWSKGFRLTLLLLPVFQVLDEKNQTERDQNRGSPQRTSVDAHFCRSEGATTRTRERLRAREVSCRVTSRRLLAAATPAGPLSPAPYLPHPSPLYPHHPPISESPPQKLGVIVPVSLQAALMVYLCCQPSL